MMSYVIHMVLNLLELLAKPLLELVAINFQIYAEFFLYLEYTMIILRTKIILVNTIF